MAIAGIILPILPTTPLLLVAVWAFGKSSPELAEKIRNHRVFGPPVRDWQDHGVISLKAKVAGHLRIMALHGRLALGLRQICRCGLPLLIIAVMVGAGNLCGKPAQRSQGRRLFREGSCRPPDIDRPTPGRGLPPRAVHLPWLPN